MIALAPAMRRGTADRGTIGRAAPASIGAAAALAASAGPLPVQLGFAVVAVGVIGMAHGASDLAVVAPRRRPAFLLLYLVASAACLVWWVASPGVALPLFLLASAIHFGLEDAPAGAPLERVLRGTSLVASPAVLHSRALSDLLRLAGGDAALPPGTVTAMAVAGGLAAAALLALAAGRRDGRLAAGTLAVVTLPPLVGFSVGFLILHALPQTRARARQIGCRDGVAYLRRVAPVLLLAVALVGAIGAALLRLEPSGVRSLFAAIAALAIPHLLVTPWFETVPQLAEARPAGLAAR